MDGDGIAGAAAAETEHDRRVKYRKLRAAGMGDKAAMEAVWPSTQAGMLKKAKEDGDAAAAKQGD